MKKDEKKVKKPKVKKPKKKPVKKVVRKVKAPKKPPSKAPMPRSIPVNMTPQVVYREKTSTAPTTTTAENELVKVRAEEKLKRSEENIKRQEEELEEAKTEQKREMRNTLGKLSAQFTGKYKKLNDQIKLVGGSTPSQSGYSSDSDSGSTPKTRTQPKKGYSSSSSYFSNPTAKYLLEDIKLEDELRYVLPKQPAFFAQNPYGGTSPYVGKMVLQHEPGHEHTTLEHKISSSIRPESRQLRFETEYETPKKEVERLKYEPEIEEEAEEFIDVGKLEVMQKSAKEIIAENKLEDAQKLHISLSERAGVIPRDNYKNITIGTLTKHNNYLKKDIERAERQVVLEGRNKTFQENLAKSILRDEQAEKDKAKEVAYEQKVILSRNELTTLMKKYKMKKPANFTSITLGELEDQIFKIKEEKEPWLVKRARRV